MKRRLFAILAALSLLLCVAVGGLWVRSYIVRDMVAYNALGDGWEYAGPAENEVNSASFVPVRSGATATSAVLSSRPGVCAFVCMRLSARVGVGASVHLAEADKGVRYHSERMSPANASSSGGFLGFYFASDDVSNNLGVWRNLRVSLPYWFLVSCTTVLPILWLRNYTRWRRDRSLCESCGYDLRATPGRWPECGLVPAAPPPPPTMPLRGNVR